MFGTLWFEGEQTKTIADRTRIKGQIVVGIRCFGCSR
jgi:hypothetical protein